MWKPNKQTKIWNEIHNLNFTELKILETQFRKGSSLVTLQSSETSPVSLRLLHRWWNSLPHTWRRPRMRNPTHGAVLLRMLQGLEFWWPWLHHFTGLWNAATRHRNRHPSVIHRDDELGKSPQDCKRKRGCKHTSCSVLETCDMWLPCSTYSMRIPTKIFYQNSSNFHFLSCCGRSSRVCTCYCGVTAYSIMTRFVTGFKLLSFMVASYEFRSEIEFWRNYAVLASLKLFQISSRGPVNRRHCCSIGRNIQRRHTLLKLNIARSC